MRRLHDRPSGSLAPPSAAPAGASVDVLSDVLRAVRLTGAVFFLVEASAPWVIELPDGATLAPSIPAGAQSVISYHVVLRGSCWAELPGGASALLEAGDVLVFPRGDAYVMSMARGMRGGPPPSELVTFMREMSAGHLPFVVTEGGGGADRLDLVCGFLGCDLRPFNPLLATLPAFLHLRRAFAPGDDPLGRLIELTIAESREHRPGGDCVRLRLSELMFVEVVRRYLATLPGEQPGWLAGLRDPLVGRALTRLHERPADPWTLDGLARDVGASRSVLAERFAHFVGQPPMQYLTHWRMQVAARRLDDGRAKVSAVAQAVGYESEAAFSRAFKRVAGASPASWRARRAAATVSASTGAP